MTFFNWLVIFHSAIIWKECCYAKTIGLIFEGLNNSQVINREADTKVGHCSGASMPFLLLGVQEYNDMRVEYFAFLVNPQGSDIE